MRVFISTMMSVSHGAYIRLKFARVCMSASVGTFMAFEISTSLSFVSPMSKMDDGGGKCIRMAYSFRIKKEPGEFGSTFSLVPWKMHQFRPSVHVICIMQALPVHMENWPWPAVG